MTRIQSMATMTLTVTLAATLAAVLLLVPGTGMAQGRGQSPPQRTAARADSPIERAIREWFGNPQNLSGLPPGLAKRETLAPGLQRQLRERGQLPPGLRDRAYDLPHELVIRLPRIEENHRWITIGGNVILLDETTSLIVDLIADVF
jgi:Ni/Co efflux regulator RcnB